MLYCSIFSIFISLNVLILLKYSNTDKQKIANLFKNILKINYLNRFIFYPRNSCLYLCCGNWFIKNNQTIAMFS